MASIGVERARYNQLNLGRAQGGSGSVGGSPGPMFNDAPVTSSNLDAFLEDQERKTEERNRGFEERTKGMSNTERNEEAQRMSTQNRTEIEKIKLNNQAKAVKQTQVSEQKEEDKQRKAQENKKKEEDEKRLFVRPAEEMIVQTANFFSETIIIPLILWPFWLTLKILELKKTYTGTGIGIGFIDNYIVPWDWKDFGMFAITAGTVFISGCLILGVIAFLGYILSNPDEAAIIVPVLSGIIGSIMSPI